MRYFATAIPGLHPVLAREIEALRDARAAPLHEFDGRNDVVSFTARGPDGLIGLRTGEDVFAEVSSVHGQERLRAVVGGLWNRQGLERALSAYAGVHPLRARITFRVVARVRSEQQFLRTELRDELVRRVLQTPLPMAPRGPRGPGALGPRDQPRPVPPGHPPVLGRHAPPQLAPHRTPRRPPPHGRRGNGLPGSRQLPPITHQGPTTRLRGVKGPTIRRPGLGG